MTKQQIVEAVKIWHSTHPTNELESWKIQNLMGNILGWNTPEQVEVSKMMTKKQVTTNQTANVNSPGDNATANVNEDVPDIGEVSNPLHHSYREAMARSGGTLAEWLVEQEDIEEEHHCGAWTHNCITKEKLNAFLEKFFITKYEAQLAIAQAKAAGAKEEREKILREGLFVGDYDLELLGYRLKLLSNELFLDYFYEEWSKENDGIFGSKNPEEAKEWLQNGIKRNFFRHDSVGIQKKGAKLMQIAMERLASFAAEPLSPKEEIVKQAKAEGFAEGRKESIARHGEEMLEIVKNKVEDIKKEERERINARERHLKQKEAAASFRSPKEERKA